MAHVYRGKKRPRVYSSKWNGYSINDYRFGWSIEVTGFTEAQATRDWERGVDREMFQQAIATGHYSHNVPREMVDGALYRCTICGSAVMDIFTHTDWHVSIAADRVS